VQSSGQITTPTNQHPVITKVNKLINQSNGLFQTTKVHIYSTDGRTNRERKTASADVALMSIHMSNELNINA